jgi:shikimate dehydrogenase
VIHLGLIGHGIGRSLTPGLHVVLGELTGRTVEYPIFDRDHSFTPQLSNFLTACESSQRAGINVTHPFKEAICEHIELADEFAAIGACNTIRFLPGGRRVGYNTDCSGLQAALLPFLPPGGLSCVALLGAGGFGKAAAFALCSLGVKELRVFDVDNRRASELAHRVASHFETTVVAASSAETACLGSTGIVNCTPVGMHHHPGNPVVQDCLDAMTWAFDAVYIPIKTEFLAMVEASGAVAISGSELFFWQAIHAFQHFTATTLTTDVIAEARHRVWPEVERRARTGE